MNASEPLPEMLAEVAPLTRRSSRVRSAAAVPAVPVPSEPVLHLPFLSTEAPAAAKKPAIADEPAVEQPAAEAPRVAEEPVAEVIEAATAEEPADEPVDLFIEAARALNFTGETPIASDEPRPAPQAKARPAHRSRPTTVRRVATLTASISAFGVVGLLAVGMTTPFSALAPTKSASAAAGVSIAAAEEAEQQIQAFVAPAEVKNAEVQSSGGYETATFAELAEVTGINTANAFYVNDPTADIQWPIALGTSKSYSFGQRWGRLHEGIDFTPGNGAPVQAIADGTVRIATESGGAYGVNVYIDHVIDGEMITSHYAHMQYGSLRVSQGQQVEVGDVIGLVGNTGRSFGAHLHFELRLPNNQAIDPMPWLQQYAGTHYPKTDAAEEEVASASDE
ncbi:M23 family metallopeptidase [Microbacterium paludicola]|uniref:M23 family metallopeptidase n=1 Tax=Microbacterium paludicola TaxID=300019 RepID=UPI0031D7CE80